MPTEKERLSWQRDMVYEHTHCLWLYSYDWN